MTKIKIGKEKKHLKRVKKSYERQFARLCGGDKFSTYTQTSITAQNKLNSNPLGISKQ